MIMQGGGVIFVVVAFLGRVLVKVRRRIVTCLAIYLEFSLLSLQQIENGTQRKDMIKITLENIARIAKSCPENISLVVEVSSCFY